MHRRAFLLLTISGLTGCATVGRGKIPTVPSGLDGPYRLDSGDKLRVTVFEQASLSNSYSVDQAGYIAFPLIGNVPARGLTTQELAGAIAKGLRAGYLRNPDVSVEVDTYRPFFIMGEVRTPGQYTYVNGLTAQTAIAIAGGFTARGNDREVEVSRQVNGKVITGRIPVAAAVRPGDIIRVLPRLF